MLNIYDVVTRLNVLVEGVKKDRSDALAGVIWTMRGEIRKILAGIAHPTMGDLTKSELNAILAQIVTLNNRTLGVFNNEYMDWLEQFVNADAVLLKRVLSTALIWRDTPDADIQTTIGARNFFKDQQANTDLKPLLGWAAITPTQEFNALWSRISNAPSAATGATPADVMNGFTASASLSVIKAIRAAWVNNETVADTVTAIVGTTPQGTGGVLDRVLNGGKATSNTLIQQANATANAAIQSAITSRYRWDSIMDSVTTSICRGLNGKIFVFGSGPLPPQHMNCRSHITPIVPGDVDSGPDTFYNWASTQPVAFLREVFDVDRAKSLADGSAKKTDFNGFQATKALTISQFSDTINSILST